MAQFLTENLKAKVAVLNSVLNKDDTKMAFSTRDEHPEWFEELETNYTTKVCLEYGNITHYTISNLKFNTFQLK